MLFFNIHKQIGVGRGKIVRSRYAVRNFQVIRIYTSAYTLRKSHRLDVFALEEYVRRERRTLFALRH